MWIKACILRSVNTANKYIKAGRGKDIILLQKLHAGGQNSFTIPAYIIRHAVIDLISD